MGKLLALALVCTLAGAVFFRPILMGRPRRAPIEHHDPLGRSYPLDGGYDARKSADNHHGADTGNTRR